MATISPTTSGTVTTDGTEQTLYENTIGKPIAMDVDMSNIRTGDTFLLRVYKKILPAGSYVKFFEETISGLTGSTPNIPGLNGQPLGSPYAIKITIQKTAGTNRSFDWGIWQAN